MPLRGLGIGQNKLVFPGGRQPSFDPSHILSPFCYFSAITPNGGGIRLFPKIVKATPTSVTTAVDSILGPCSSFASGTSNLSFSAEYQYPITQGGTIACIIRAPATLTTTQYIGSPGAGSSNGWRLCMSSAFILGVSTPSGGVHLGTTTLVASAPYFIIASVGTNGQNYLAKRLDTGQVSWSSNTTSPTIAAGFTTTFLGGNWTGTTSFNGLMSVFMASAVKIGISEMRQAAEDPWSFWYPDRTFAVSQVFMSQGSQAVASLPPGKGIFDTPIQPDGYNRELRSWARGYNPNLIGQDVLPFRNNPTNDLPMRLSDYIPHLRSWYWQYNPNLIGQDVLPFRNQQETKPGPAWRSETLYPNLLTGALQPLPSGHSLYDLPLRLSDPFSQWRTWNSGYNPNLIGQDILPFRNQQEIKPGPTWRVDTIPQNLLGTLLSVTQVMPVGSQLYDLPLRLTDTFQTWRSWYASYNPNLIGQDVLPFRNLQDVPLGNTWRADFTPPNQLPTLLQIINALPIGAQIFDLPQRLLDPFSHLRTWAWSYNVNLIGQDVLPFRNLQDVPLGNTWRADTIPPNLLAVLLAAPVVPLPPGQAYFTLPILGPQQLSPTTMVNLLQSTLTPALPTFTAVYNTVLLSIPGGMFSIPGDPPS